MAKKSGSKPKNAVKRMVGGSSKKRTPKTTAKKAPSSKKSSTSPKSQLKAFGGRSLEGRRKERRPLVENKLTHVVMTSSEAAGRYAFTKPANHELIEQILEDRAAQFDLRVLSFEAHGQNLHIFLTFKNRKGFQAFLRVVTALIARQITGARKGHPFGRKFWDHIAFSRTVESDEGAVEEFESASKTARKSGRLVDDILG